MFAEGRVRVSRVKSRGHYLLAFTVPFLWYRLLACQPLNLRTGSARDGSVSSTSSGPHENLEQLTALVPAHLGCPGASIVNDRSCRNAFDQHRHLQEHSRSFSNFFDSGHCREKVPENGYRKWCMFTGSNFKWSLWWHWYQCTLIL